MSTDTKEQWTKSIHKTISDKKKGWIENRSATLIIGIVSYPFVVLILAGLLTSFDTIDGQTALGIATVITYLIYQNIVSIRRAWRFQETMYTMQEILLYANMTEGELQDFSHPEGEPFDGGGDSEPIDLG